MKLKSKELVKILKKREVANKKIQDVHKELVDADKRHKKLQHEVQRLKDKGVKILDKVLIKAEALKEFDYTGQMEILNEEEFEIEIHNAFNDVFKKPEELKERLREDMKEKKNLWADELMFTGHKEK